MSRRSDSEPLESGPPGYDVTFRNGSAPAEEEHPEVFVTRETECGLGNCRPSWMHGWANIRSFTVVLSFWSLFGSINFSYYSSVITQIEREFGLSSSMTGFIKNVDNIGYISTVIIFSHFCRYANKPRLFATVTLMSSAAIFLFAVPHFLYGSRKVVPELDGNMTKPKNSTVEYCDGVQNEDTEQFCSALGSMKSFNVGALAIFISSEILQGIAQSPKFTLSMTYMDDNAKDKSPFYFSFMFAMRAFSPVGGYMLGAWTTTLYVDLSDPGLSQKDPRWVGAWWLGFVICSVTSVVWALPMLLFPPILKDMPKEEREKLNQQESILTTAKDLPRALSRLIRNKLYVAVVCAICVEVYLMGFFTFLPKYQEQYFGTTASLSSITTGAVGALAYAIGPVMVGFFMSRVKKLTPLFAMKVIVGCTGVSVTLYVAMMFMNCPDPVWAGDLKANNFSMACNSNCSCEATDFKPVCGADGINYYSPCQAGCSHAIQANGTTTYEGCQCVEGGSAIEGICERQCFRTYIPYAVLLFLCKFIGSMDTIPTMTILMRSVATEDKANALAFCIGLLVAAAFPAPMVYGAVIDSSCVVLQQSCTGSRSGACLLYDNQAFKYRLHGFTIAVKTGAFLFYLLALYFSTGPEYAQYADTEEQERKEAKEMQAMLPETAERRLSADIIRDVVQ